MNFDCSHLFLLPPPFRPFGRTHTHTHTLTHVDVRMSCRLQVVVAGGGRRLEPGGALSVQLHAAAPADQPHLHHHLHPAGGSTHRRRPGRGHVLHYLHRSPARYVTLAHTCTHTHTHTLTQLCYPAELVLKTCVQLSQYER